MVNYAALLPVLALLSGVANAHSRVFGLYVNDAFQGDGRTAYIRSPPSNSPIKDVSSADIVCNSNNVAAPSSVSVNAGDKVTFEWYHDNRGDDIIDGSHQGPITVYIADAATNGKGGVWTKLYEDGFANGQWAVGKLIANGGKHSLTLPAALAAGDYLLRAEIIAHHESETDFTKNSARGAQFYPSCAQISVKTGGSVKPSAGFNFIGGYTPTDPGILFNIYNAFTSYAIPGPAVWTGSAGDVGATPAPPIATATSTVVAPVVTPAPTPVVPVVTPAPTPVVPVVPVVPTTLATLTRTATTATVPVATNKTSVDINACLDAVNVCINNAQSKTGGAVNFSACEAQRAACY